MPDSDTFESAKDDSSEGSEQALNKSSDDEPLVRSKSSPSKSKSPSKSSKKKTKKDKKKSKKVAKGAKSKAKSSRAEVRLVAADPRKESEEEYEVEAIVGHREYNGRLKYKIRWKGYEAMQDTWEDYEFLSCPDLLEMYNIKHKVEVREIHKQKKRKVANPGSPSKVKKHKNSVSDDDGEESDEIPYDEGSDAEYEVDKIVEMRMKTDGTREFLVHWKRWSSEHDTWEPEENLNCKDLIDKFAERVEDAKNSNVKELRTSRKHTDRFTLNTQDHGRRLSKRNRQKQRVAYFDAEGGDD